MFLISDLVHQFKEFWNRAPLHPVLIRNAQRLIGMDLSAPVEEYEFLCFDTELTGLKPRRDEIVSIGAVRIRDLRIVAGDNFFAYARPRRDLPKDSTMIHRITPEQIKHAPTLDEILPDFVEYCGKAFLIGHYVQIDLAFLRRATWRHLGGAINNPALDCLRLAQTLEDYKLKHARGHFQRVHSFGLNALAKDYGLPTFEQHDALEDALQTAYLFLYLIKTLKEYGFSSLKDYYEAGRVGPRVSS